MRLASIAVLCAAAVSAASDTLAKQQLSDAEVVLRNGGFEALLGPELYALLAAGDAESLPDAGDLADMLAVGFARVFERTSMPSDDVYGQMPSTALDLAAMALDSARVGQLALTAERAVSPVAAIWLVTARGMQEYAGDAQLTIDALKDAGLWTDPVLSLPRTARSSAIEELSDERSADSDGDAESRNLI